LIYETYLSETTPESWVAEAVDYANEGVIYSTLFYGQAAKERAEEYAAWKNGAVESQPRPMTVT
jgi:hypothetical protein